ncbi:MAG: hypothetical protein ACI4LR_09105, partial [Treponema sp.]
MFFILCTSTASADKNNSRARKKHWSCSRSKVLSFRNKIQHGRTFQAVPSMIFTGGVIKTLPEIASKFLF